MRVHRVLANIALDPILVLPDMSGAPRTQVVVQERARIFVSVGLRMARGEIEVGTPPSQYERCIGNGSTFVWFTLSGPPSALTNGMSDEGWAPVSPAFDAPWPFAPEINLAIALRRVLNSSRT